MRPRLDYLKTASSAVGFTKVLSYKPQEAKLAKLNKLFKPNEKN